MSSIDLKKEVSEIKKQQENGTFMYQENKLDEFVQNDQIDALSRLLNPMKLMDWFDALEDLSPKIKRSPGYMRHVPLAALTFVKWARRFQSLAKQQITKNGRLEFTDFDTETTGLDSKRKFLEGLAGVTDIGAVKIIGTKYLGNEINQDGIQDDETINDYEMQSLMNPGVNIPVSVQEITHITNEMVSQAPSQYDRLIQFKKFSKDTLFLGHNIGDDLQNKNGYDLPNVLEPIYERYFNQNSNKMLEQAIDTKPMFQGLVAGIPHTNTVLADLFDIKLVGAHRAMPDVRVHALAFSKFLPLLLSLDVDALEKYASRKLNKKNFILKYLRPGALIDENGVSKHWVEFGISMDKHYNYGRRKSTTIIKFDLDQKKFVYDDIELKDGRFVSAKEASFAMPRTVLRRQAMILTKTNKFSEAIADYTDVVF